PAGPIQSSPRFAPSTAPHSPIVKSIRTTHTSIRLISNDFPSLISGDIPTSLKSIPSTDFKKRPGVYPPPKMKPAVAVPGVCRGGACSVRPQDRSTLIWEHPHPHLTPLF